MSLLPAKSWPYRKVRQTFIEYFQKTLGHTFVKSSPVVPFDDPTLLFTNAGMNQYKPLFLGQVKPGSYLEGLRRACNSQACIRAGGKHNDLEDVGKDVYHHTFFEMLGNWSFGDYFKKEAIGWAWKLLTEVYEFPKDRLYATYFGGDAESGLEPDLEARNLWLQFLPEGHVIPGNKKDNFWEMGEVGPCGPCSEIHFDRLGGRFAAQLVNQDDPNVLEVWNIVFIQFNREMDKTLKMLPEKHVDTGMGFERLCSVLQKKTSNYDSDVFTPLLKKMEELSNVHPYTGKVGVSDTGNIDMAYRVVVDHIRTISFAISDGCIPAGTGRGYVVRRILRRAIRYGQEILQAKPGFFVQLLPVLIEQMKDFFPLLEKKQQLIEEIIADEETTFTRTLEKGLKFFNKEAEKLKQLNQTVVSGELAFYLYGTLGFPFDLTQILAGEKGLTVNVDEFNRNLEESRELARNSQKDLYSGKELHLTIDDIAGLSNKGTPFTNDKPKYVWDQDHSSNLVAMYKAKPVGFVDHLDAPPSTSSSSSEDLIGVILDQTAFYATAGGQVCDRGKLVNEEADVEFEVYQTQSFGGYIVHIGRLLKGSLKENMELINRVDYATRWLIAPNHTGTHVLNFALRNVLNADIDQKGSLVDEAKLRFDFNSNKALSPTEIEGVESMVNDSIQQALPVYTQEVPLEEAKKINGLRAVFGEVYPNPVRVVSVGVPVVELIKDPSNPKWKSYSIEFCGGTHLPNTAKIGCFVLTEEGSIAKGIRRVVGLTGDAAVNALSVGEELMGRVKQLENAPLPVKETRTKDLTSELSQCVTSLSLKNRIREVIAGIEKELLQHHKEEAARQQQVVAGELAALVEKQKANQLDYAIHTIKDSIDSSAVVKIMEQVRKSNAEVSLMVVSLDEAKRTAGIFCSIGSAHPNTTSLAWMQSSLAACNGRGGGKGAIVQGQTKELDAIPKAIEAAVRFLTQ